MSDDSIPFKKGSNVLTKKRQTNDPQKCLSRKFKSMNRYCK